MTNSSNSKFNTCFLTAYFSDLQDPRRTHKGNLKHRFTDILLLVLVSVLCKCDEWDEMSLFCQHELDWFKKYGDFSNGVPSGSTIRRVIMSLSSDTFQSCLSSWAFSLLGNKIDGVVAIDGKTICGAKQKSDSSSIAPHILSAMASESGICIGQIKTEEKSNEITAIPKLIESLSIEDCTVTIDAMGCQREIVKTIVEQKANYVIAAKANQGDLLKAIKDTVLLEKPTSVDITENVGHGRVEKRTAKVFNNISHFENANQWNGLCSFIAIEKESYSKSTKKTTSETRYYISNVKLNAKQVNHIVRSHWSIENKLHWSLDVIFGEDHSRKRTENTPENMNVIIKIALTLVNQEQTFKKSKNKKRLKALLDRKYREKILGF